MLAATVWEDPGRRRPPSYIPTTLRYNFLRPCSTAHLPTLLHVENPACGSSLVVCLKVSQTAYFPSCNLVLKLFLINHHAALFPLLHGICFFFVGVCVFNLCYWVVIVSFLPLFANRAIHFTWLLLRPFGQLHKSLFSLKSVSAVPPKCHTGNVFTFLRDCGKGDWFCYPPHPTPA